MKKALFLVMYSLAIFGCTRHAIPDRDLPTAENIMINKNEGKEEYELIIIDPQFDTWFATNARPIQFYSKEYYENKNQRYVTSWNELYQTTGGAGPFGNYINYNFSKDYGLELNYRLFWYFKYIESLYGPRYGFSA